jgi:Xaa-Pro aminopeptidase
VNAAEYQERRRRAVEGTARAQLDGLLLSTGPNARYLTGFTGSNALVLLSPRGTWLFTDPRYAIQAGEQTDCPVKVAKGPLFPLALKIAQRSGVRKLGYEPSRLACDEFAILQENLFPGASLQPAGGIVESLRMIKSPDEIDLVRKSVAIASKAFDRSLRRVRAGIRESEVAAELEYQMRLLGAEKPSFDTIVAFGARTALPHAQPTSGALSLNQLLLVDMGASRDGYASDMTRVAFLGKPGTRVRQLYRAVLDAQLAAISAVRPGVRAEQVDGAARRVLRARKLDKAFVHSTGHGLGLEIHELPRIGRRDKTRLSPGMVITIEPGAYLEGFGGIRIEDTVLVTETGCEVLTPTSKDLLVF